MTEYAVVDLETSGFHPPAAEIIEVAVVHVDSAGLVTGSWDTLVRPEGAVGATHVHGVTPLMVHGAPRFGDIAAVLHRLLEGRVVVAHNLSFDAKFLVSAFAGAGFGSPEIMDGACTLKIAQRHLPGPPHKLADCCRHTGIVLADAHKALGDATATAKLLGHFIRTGVAVGGRPVRIRIPGQQSGTASEKLFVPR
jgi:DNA polymerase III subunit epsilon